MKLSTEYLCPSCNGEDQLDLKVFDAVHKEKSLICNSCHTRLALDEAGESVIEERYDLLKGVAKQQLLGTGISTLVMMLHFVGIVPMGVLVVGLLMGLGIMLKGHLTVLPPAELTFIEPETTSENDDASALQADSEAQVLQD
uniref:hypothetical protein n=1 Tax=Thaumasiovibrio occultus TaxID=1891184 RepID=UPI000B34AA6A|nr:hypothetical protein [Thaumasiovibrio occultus]